MQLASGPAKQSLASPGLGLYENTGLGTLQSDQQPSCVFAYLIIMQEWVIEQKNERIKKIISKRTARKLPSSAYEELFNEALFQIPKVQCHASSCSSNYDLENNHHKQKFERRSLDKYLVFLGSLEDNFTEFRRLSEELNKVAQFTHLAYCVGVYSISCDMSV